jgi:hypothetical protein
MLMKVTFVDPKHNTHRMRADLYRGVYSRVARRLQVHRSLVSRVARGEKKSKRVQRALAYEFRRVERLSQAA